jgi:hypothetical protein
VAAHPANEFPVDDSGYGFDNNSDVLSVSPLLMEKYLQAAKTISKLAVYGETLPPKPGLIVRLLNRRSQDNYDVLGSGNQGVWLPYSLRGAMYGSYIFRSTVNTSSACASRTSATRRKWRLTIPTLTPEEKAAKAEEARKAAEARRAAFAGRGRGAGAPGAAGQPAGPPAGAPGNPGAAAGAQGGGGAAAGAPQDQAAQGGPAGARRAQLARVLDADAAPESHDPIPHPRSCARATRRHERPLLRAS